MHCSTCCSSKYTNSSVDSYFAEHHIVYYSTVDQLTSTSFSIVSACHIYTHRYNLILSFSLFSFDLHQSKISRNRSPNTCFTRIHFITLRFEMQIVRQNLIVVFLLSKKKANIKRRRRNIQRRANF